jgi:hypothetical protein
MKTELLGLLTELHERFPLNDERILVIGCSTSEVLGKTIGKAGSIDVASELMEAFLEFSRRIHPEGLLLQYFVIEITLLIAVMIAITFFSNCYHHSYIIFFYHHHSNSNIIVVITIIICISHHDV